MKIEVKSFGLYIIILILVIFSCEFTNPFFDERGSLTIKCIINKNKLDKPSDESSFFTIDRLRCIISKDGAIKKDFNLTKEGNRFKGSVKLKKGNYDITLEAYDESNFQAYSGRQSGVEVSPLKTTEVTINLEPNEVYLTTLISPSNAGNISKNPNKNSYNYNETVQLNASPSSGYEFERWEGDLSGNSKPANIIMNRNKNITAVFVPVAETVSTPNPPSGSSTGTVGQTLSYSTSGAASNLGHTVEYRFDWGDGNYSNWGSSSQSYSYNNVGTYSVKAQARCQTRTTILSNWSGSKSVVLSGYSLNIIVSPSGSGSVSKNPHKNEYNHNEIVQLTAIQNSGYQFEHWEGDLSNNNNPPNITMNGNKNITAVFIQVDETISSPNPPSGAVSGIVGQSLSYSTNGSTSNLGHTVEYRFDWGDGNISDWGSTTQSYVYNNVGTYQIKAQARCQTHTTILSNWSASKSVVLSGHSLNIIVSPSGSGSVSKNPYKNEYNHNEIVQLTAIQNSGYQFDHWEGDLSDNINPENITMNGNKNVTAVFIPVDETISSPNIPSGPSNGTVGQSLTFSTSGSISNLGHAVEYRFDWGDGSYSNWGSSSQSYSYNNVGTYTVKAQARCQTHTNILSNWSSGKSVSISGHALNVTINPSGSGSVTPNPKKTEYNHNEVVQLTAIATTGYQFDHWEGDLSGDSNQVNIIMDGNKNVTAVFIPVDETISSPNIPSGPSNGTVGQSLTFSTSGSTSNLGHAVEYRFDWGDGNSSSWGDSTQSHVYNIVGTYQVKAQARCQTHTNILSNWSPGKTLSISGHELNITIKPPGSGNNVTKNPHKTEYNHNEVVQLTATAVPGYRFDHWEGDLSGNSNPENITMNGNKNVTAVFSSTEQTWKGYAIKDAFVSTELPDQNWGNSVILFLEYDHADSEKHKILLDFDVENSIPSTATVKSAKLGLYFKEGLATEGAPFRVTIRLIATPWNENTITWNQVWNDMLFARTNSLDDNRVPGSGNYVEFDVTIDVPQWVNEGGKYGFYIKCHEESGTKKAAHFHSKESSSADKRPYLIIVYTQ